MGLSSDLILGSGADIAERERERESLHDQLHRTSYTLHV